MTNALDLYIEERTRELGMELFERARAAQPGIWRRAWWERKLLDAVAANPRLQTRAFQFVEALPYMHDDANVAAHLKDYLHPDHVDLPGPLRIVTAFDRPDSLFGRTIGATARESAFKMAGMFITGTNTQEAIDNALRLRSRHMAFTLDVLGEATISEPQADRAAAVYMELIETLGRAARQWPQNDLIDLGRDGPMPRANVSIKLSALDPVFDPIDPTRCLHEVGSRLLPLLRRARDLNVFVNVDMESFKYRDLTLEMFKRFANEPDLRDWPDIGIVVQAYLRDAERDLTGLLDFARRRGTPFAIRLVKGAYWDSETVSAIRNNTPIPVWTQKWQSDACYEKLSRIMLDHADMIRPAFASHNVRSLAHVMATAETLGLSPHDYELQMLSGMGDPLKKAIAQMQRCLRIYCPYGDLIQGMAYLIRRLLENTSNDSFLRQGFDDRGSYERLLANPAIARPPSGPLPTRHYQDTFEDVDMNAFTNATNTSFASADNRQRILAEIQRLRSGKPFVAPLIIGGRRIETGKWIESANPAHPKEIVGRAALAGPPHADQAVAAAADALPEWSRRSPAARADILRRAAKLLEERRPLLTAALALEIGKNARQADAEVTEAVDYCNYHAMIVERMAQRPRRRSLPGEDNLLVYDPCGVCALIGSWDFPLALVAGMVSAAIAAGNTCVLKPSSSAPLAAARLMEILHEARLPDGVVQYLPGRGETIGRLLVEHPGVHAVALCGSRPTAEAIVASAARIQPGQRHFKRTIIDASAKNAIIIDDDVDLDEAVTGVIESAFAFSGQKCTACSRAIVLDNIYNRFIERLADAARCMVIGDPAEFGTVIGPVIDPAARDAINAAIETAHENARLIWQADALALPADGFYVAPAIFADVDPASPLAQHEIFGPVLAVLHAADFSHAIELANDSAYALTGGIYTRRPAHIQRARDEFRVGNLYINRKITGSQVDVQPYGGCRLSGDGARLGGPDYLLQFCRPRTISENTLRHGLTAAEQPPEAVLH